MSLFKVVLEDLIVGKYPSHVTVYKVIMDSYSGCLMGYYLGFVSADSHRVDLALRNAILPKQVKEKYGLQNEWEQCFKRLTRTHGVKCARTG